jgi:hypothetical protein
MNTQSKVVENVERKEVIKYLRGVCKNWGDNDWGDDLHLVDILDKHLFYYLYHEAGSLKDLLSSTRQQVQEEMVVTENTSDGYHTFKELYEFRKLYNACLFNEWYSRGMYDVHKSKKHHDGEDCFGGGWFIVTAQLPTGQISNHYELKDWDLFRCVAYDTAKEWDGHSAQDVSDRLFSLLKETTK